MQKQKKVSFWSNIQRFVPFCIILFVSIFILRNSFTTGMYPTHDGNIHMIRSLHFIDELKRGQVPVRMVPSQAYSFGYLVFLYFYPLPYYLAAIFQTAGWSTVDSWRLMQLLVTFLSLWTFYRWLRCTMRPAAALTGMILYALIPYRFVTLFVTGQIGGYLAFLFAPLIGLGLQKLLASKQTVVGGILLALGMAGMILSHLLSVIIFFIPLSAYAGWLLWKDFSWKKLGSFLE